MEKSLDIRNTSELQSWLRERIAFYLDQPADTIDPDTELTHYGMNSVYAVSLLADLETKLGVEIDYMQATWGYPTVNKLVEYLEALPANREGE
ncbi:acyl carrier protein [Micromonospora sp. NPDC007230]|uniref:acyl carrier protein n=1 Tax=Micromonospora sp. NPDC007230 TaxID=3364237 RepID=UPI0036C236D0